MQRFALFLGLVQFCSAVPAATIHPQGADSAALTEALAKASQGDTVQLAAATYEIAEGLKLKSRVRVVGAGQDKTRIVFKGQKASAMIVVSGCEDTELAHLTLDGQSNPLVHQGISGNNSRKLAIHHVTVRNLVKSDTFGPHGIYFSGRNPSCEGGVTDSSISDCRFENIGLGAQYGGAVRLNWGCSRNQVLRNVVHKTGRGGIFGDHSPELIIRGNKVSGSGGEGLGIEIWGGCPRSLIEDNIVDHWISVDRGDLSAVRRNTIGTDDGTLKGYGIEIIARDIVVTDNLVKPGAQIGLSVSNKPVKNNVYWGYNTVKGCNQWGVQLQGETGGIARHYFYRCAFEDTVRGDKRATYPSDSGHAFRTNGACQQLVLEECVFRNNGGYGLQLGGPNVDQLSFLRCTIAGNGGAAVVGASQATALRFAGCQVTGNKSDESLPSRGFTAAAPKADFQMPDAILAGTPVAFQCISKAAKGEIIERLWDFGEGIPAVTEAPQHTFSKPGKYRVTLIVWDRSGQGGREEETIEVLPGTTLIRR